MASVTTCPECEAALSPGMWECASCGFDLTATVTEPVAKRRTVEAPGRPEHEPVAAPPSLCPHRHLLNPDDPCPICRAGPRVALRFPWGKVPVSDEGLKIGRAESEPGLAAQLAVYPNVSRAHALVELIGGTPSITDLGSSNGTFVDDQPITPWVRTTVEIGAVVRFGARLTCAVLEDHG